MLLTVDPTAGDGSTLSPAQLSFGVTRRSMMASAYGVPLNRVATFAVELQLLPEQECVSREELQVQLRSFSEAHVRQAASATDTVQVLSFSTPWTFGSGCGARRATPTRLMADVDMRAVFSEADQPSFELSRFSELPRIHAITPIVVSDVIQVRAASAGARPLTLSDSNADSGGISLNIGMIAGGGARALLLSVVAGVILYRRFGSNRVLVTKSMNFDTMKLPSMKDPVQANLSFHMLNETESCLGSPIASRVGSREGFVNDIARIHHVCRHGCGRRVVGGQEAHADLWSE
eukprot:1497539-Rhodomonas_salina.1